jgi:hypothetical protein
MSTYTYTEKEINAFAEMRGAEWDDECNQFLWDIVHSGETQIRLHGLNTTNKWAVRANELVVKFDGNGRVRHALEKAAIKLGADIAD